MAYTFPIYYGRLTHAQILSSKRLWTRCNNFIEIPEAAQAGAITCNVLTAGTATTVAEGTALANATANTQVAMTYVPKQVTHTLLPTQRASYFAKPENLERISENHADAISYSADGALIADMYAATPGLSVTLAAGLMNFKLGTAAQNLVHLELMMRLVSFLFASRADASPEDFTIVMQYLAWSNFTAIRSQEAPGPILDKLTGAYTFMGIPMFSTLYSTNFGLASRPAAYVFHKDALGCAFSEPFVMGGGPMWHYDGCIKWTTIGAYAHGVCTPGLIGEALNVAS